MLRALFALAILCMASNAMAQMVVGDDEHAADAHVAREGIDARTVLHLERDGQSNDLPRVSSLLRQHFLSWCPDGVLQ